MLKLTEYVILSVCICAWTRDGDGETDFCCSVQLNLINSEMEIISAWSTAETRMMGREKAIGKKTTE